MFANAEGISQRAPVRWSESVIGAAVCFPYVVALDENFITIHSMLDQQLKQTLSFRDGHILQDFEGTVGFSSGPLSGSIELLSDHSSSYFTGTLQV